MFFWIYMIFSLLNIIMLFYYISENHYDNHLAFVNITMFIYCMMQGWICSKKDGIEI